MMNPEFPITYKRTSRARRISLSIAPGGEVRVSFPFFSSRKTAEDFVARKAEWIRGKVEKYKGTVALPKATNRHFSDNKEAARSLIASRLEFFNRSYGYRWSGIRIGRQKSRWGSCSRRGTLSFTYALLFLPAELRDYVVVHELCHLGEFNHSTKFWALVAREMPEWKTLRKELRKHIAR